MSAKIESDLQLFLDKVGTEFVPCPKSESNVDPLLHDLFVCKRAEGYFKKRADAAKAALKENGFTENMPEPGSKAVLATGNVYSLNAAVKNPSKTLDKTKLMTVLATKFGLKSDQVQEIIDECSKENKPAETLEAVPLG